MGRRMREASIMDGLATIITTLCTKRQEKTSVQNSEQTTMVVPVSMIL